MKNFATSILFCFGIAGYAACLTDTFPPVQVNYQATIAADLVQHVRIDGGGYFFKPLSVIVKVVA